MIHNIERQRKIIIHFYTIDKNYNNKTIIQFTNKAHRHNRLVFY